MDQNVTPMCVSSDLKNSCRTRSCSSLDKSQSIPLSAPNRLKRLNSFPFKLENTTATTIMKDKR